MLNTRSSLRPSSAPWSACLAMFAALAIGCTADESPQSPPSETAPQASAQTTAADAPAETSSDAKAEPDVTLVSFDEFKETVAGLQGKVVLVDFWATWCGPCVEQFPHSLELAARLRDRDFALVTVSMDDAANEPAVRKFLAGKSAVGPNLHNLQSSQESGLEAISAFGLDNDVVPNYWIYDRAGNLAVRLSPSDPAAHFNIAQIDEAVEKLLDAK